MSSTPSPEPAAIDAMSKAPPSTPAKPAKKRARPAKKVVLAESKRARVEPEMVSRPEKLYSMVDVMTLTFGDLQDVGLCQLAYLNGENGEVVVYDPPTGIRLVCDPRKSPFNPSVWNISTTKSASPEVYNDVLALQEWTAAYIAANNDDGRFGTEFVGPVSGDFVNFNADASYVVGKKKDDVINVEFRVSGISVTEVKKDDGETVLRARLSMKPCIHESEELPEFDE